MTTQSQPPRTSSTPSQVERFTLSESSPESVGVSAQLRIAGPGDLQYVIALSKKFTNEIGFLPRAALDWYLQNSRITFALENGEPCGFILGRKSLRWNRSLRPITQAAIQFDAQRRSHGLAVVQHTADMALLAGQQALQAMCRDGLDSNEFWQIAGFIKIGSYLPGNARAKQINCWRKPLQHNRPAWFEVMPPVAGWKGKRVNEPKPPNPIGKQLALFSLPQSARYE